VGKNAETSAKNSSRSEEQRSANSMKRQVSFGTTPDGSDGAAVLVLLTL